MTKTDRHELAEQLRAVAQLLEENHLAEVRGRLVAFVGDLMRKEATGRAKSAIGVKLRDALTKYGFTINWTPEDD